MAMTSLRVRINPGMLSWARKTAGISIEDAARKIGGSSLSPDKLLAWELGNDQPTANYLRKAAEVYKRPLGTFFLSEFPKEFTIPRDFRRLPGDGERTLSPALRLQLRQSEERREI